MNIGNWDESRLARFIQAAVRSAMSSLPKAMTLERVEVTRKLTVSDELELSPQAVKYLKDKLGLP